MNEDVISEIREELKIAENLVSGLEESLKGEAFKFVLSRLRNNDDIEDERFTAAEEPEETSGFFTKLSKKTQISEATLKLLFDYDEGNNSFTLNFTPNTKKVKDAQLEATVIYLVAKYAGLSDRSADSYELHNVMEHLAIGQLNHYAKYMGSEKSYLLMAGNKKKTYTLTQLGYEFGIKLLKSEAQEVEIK